MREDSPKPIGMIFNGAWSQYAVATAPKYREFIEIHVRDLRADRALRCLDRAFPERSRDRGSSRCAYAFLATGKKSAVFGDSAHWIDAQWEDRPVNNYWWADDPARPPIANTRFEHSLVGDLRQPR